jgi:hypothetical protein
LGVNIFQEILKSERMGERNGINDFREFIDKLEKEGQLVG